MDPQTQAELDARIAEMENAARVPVMRECIQHGQVTTWQHCVRVARAAVSLGKALHLHVSQRELVRAALLHDYFLYDWHEPGHTKHATMHPVFALQNAREDFELTPLEENAIAAHMSARQQHVLLNARRFRTKGLGRMARRIDAMIQSQIDSRNEENE